mmetsp:Transcript_18333/g.51947  ORF Transcript_18333/g.51947 Transcript_18333/m.51947 type:complete len:351 (+) Transcript_18333:499-1551(+)
MPDRPLVVPVDGRAAPREHHDEERDDRQHEAAAVVEQEQPDVAAVRRPARVLVLDRALQVPAALVRGVAQEEPGAPDQEDLQDPAEEDDLEGAEGAGAPGLAGVLRVVRGRGDAADVQEEAEDGAADAVRKELRALELEDEVNDLELVGLVDDEEEDQVDERVHPGDGEHRDQREQQPHGVSQAAPDRLVAGVDVVAEERADAVGLAAGELHGRLVAVERHRELPHDLLAEVGPGPVYHPVLQPRDRPRHVRVLQVVLYESGQPVDQELGPLVELLLQPVRDRFLEANNPLLDGILHLGDRLLPHRLRRHGAVRHHTGGGVDSAAHLVRRLLRLMLDLFGRGRSCPLQPT